MLLKRARHVITENTRTVAAADALIHRDLKELGRLMAEAHVSYSVDFEASCVEADTMVTLAHDLPGLIGARLTGGGFGGCTINLVEQGKAKEFAEGVGCKLRYRNGNCSADSHLPRVKRSAQGGCKSLALKGREVFAIAGSVHLTYREVEDRVSEVTPILIPPLLPKRFSLLESFTGFQSSSTHI